MSYRVDDISHTHIPQMIHLFCRCSHHPWGSLQVAIKLLATFRKSYEVLYQSVLDRALTAGSYPFLRPMFQGCGLGDLPPISMA